MQMVKEKAVLVAVTVAMIAAVAVALRCRAKVGKLEARLGESFAVPMPDVRAHHPQDVESVALVDIPSTGVEALVDGDENALQHLHDRVAELEAIIVAKDGVIQMLGQQATKATPAAFVPPGERDRLESVKETDPERYKEMQERREEGRRHMRDSLARTSAHVLERDTSEMTETEREEYGLMVQLLEETWQLAEQMETDLPREQRREIRHALRDNMRELDPLLQAERDRVFREVGAAVGYPEDEAGAFADYLNEVVDMTSLNWLRRAGGPGGPPPRGPLPAGN